MNTKALIEKRNDLVAAMSKLFDAAEAEKRALTDEETKQFEAGKAEIEKLDATLRMHEAARSFAAVKTEQEETPAPAAADGEKYAAERRAFAAYLRGEEKREASNLTYGANGAVVPVTIADKIIETVKEICPVYARCSQYNVAGTLNFPVYDEGEDAVTVAYATEFKAMESHSGKFTTVALGGFLTGALVKISRSLINNADFDIVSYVITKVSQAVAAFLERELLKGAGGSAMTGILTAGRTIEAGASALTIDNLIDAQMAVPQVYQPAAVWIMNSKTLAAIRKIKADSNKLLLLQDPSQPFGMTLLGKPVYLSDNMPEIGASAKSVIYGDLSGIYCNIRPGAEIQLLTERYADEHVVGVTAWSECDSKMVEPQKLIVIAHAAA